MNRSPIVPFAAHSLLRRCLHLLALLSTLLGVMLPAASGAHAQTAPGGSVIS
jgi:hypothetical protein